ncbi:hypothetical protein [Nannocystis punicea]|uniref:Uncharacterized protein n=1 Tax=Nannocystis punicea TaxID=2995304 RepID=A0ABY7H3A5_9BACT|nr:hypothetical protein [Nannocystis poenicansa]WAS93746.1 hypothetical protein O0S08_47035 [Nannocystis poenicansa]
MAGGAAAATVRANKSNKAELTTRARGDEAAGAAGSAGRAMCLIEHGRTDSTAKTSMPGFGCRHEQTKDGRIAVRAL